MTRALAWYQVNYTTSARIVHANVVTTYDDGAVVGRDLELTLDGDVTESAILAVVQTLLGDSSIAPVAIAEISPSE